MSRYILFIVTASWALTTVGQTNKLTIEPNHSTIGFVVPIGGGITRVTGKFTQSDLFLDYIDRDIAKSKVRFIIKVNSIQTGIKDRDDHLLTADFFDAAQYPEIVFSSNQITGKKPHYTMEGTLQMHGVTRNINLPLEVTGELETTIGFQIRSTINRKDFDIAPDFKHTTMANFLPDVIDLEINLWTKRDKRN